MGDAPYSLAEAHELDGLIGRLNAEPLAFVVHVGDITSGAGPCSDAWLEARKRQFARIRHPFVLLPGDNEWTDCHRTGFDPLERLAKWRSLFCTPVPGLALERQPGETCENVRWQVGELTFIGLNVPGSHNDRRDPAEQARRMAAVFDWLDRSLSIAEQRGAKKIFILMQADPQFERARDGDGYARLRAVLATDAQMVRRAAGAGARRQSHLPRRPPAAGAAPDRGLRLAVGRVAARALGRRRAGARARRGLAAAPGFRCRTVEPHLQRAGAHVQVALREGDLDALGAQLVLDRPQVPRQSEAGARDALRTDPRHQLEHQAAVAEADQPDVGLAPAGRDGTVDLLRRRAAPRP